MHALKHDNAHQHISLLLLRTFIAEDGQERPYYTGRPCTDALYNAAASVLAAPITLLTGDGRTVTTYWPIRVHLPPVRHGVQDGHIYRSSGTTKVTSTAAPASCPRPHPPCACSLHHSSKVTLCNNCNLCPAAFRHTRMIVGACVVAGPP
jgi:hypothetical protein